MVAARVAEHGVEPTAIGGELWTRRRAEESLCYAGANLIPLRGSVDDLHAFADKAMSSARRCSSLVGRAELVLPMWQRLQSAWGPARDVREQPAADGAGRATGCPRSIPRCAGSASTNSTRTWSRPSTCSSVRSASTRGSATAAAATGAGSPSLIAAGRAWARFEHGEVVFKAEVGSQSPAVGQIQGVWVHPERRGHGLGTAGTAALAAAVVAGGRIASLYVNGFNTVARAAYARVGFTEVGTFATVLLD